MNIEKNKILSFTGRDFLYDIYYSESSNSKGTILFSHGFKGFKDWGTFNKMAEYFANQGYNFVKFNFTHNGGVVA